MSTLTVRLSTMTDTRARVTEAVRRALVGKAVPAISLLNFGGYDDIHHVLTPSRIAIVKALAGRGAMSIPEVADMIGRDVKAVDDDVTILVNAGVIDRIAKGIEFAYDDIRFEFDVTMTA